MRFTGDVLPAEWMPAEWMLTEEASDARKIHSWENVFARRTFRLVNPADPEQVFYCYAEKRPAALTGGKPVWRKSYGGTTQANAALSRAWVPRDGWADEAGRHEDLVATLARVFREANTEQKHRKQRTG